MLIVEPEQQPKTEINVVVLELDAEGLADEIERASRIYWKLHHRMNIASAERDFHAAVLRARPDVGEILRQREAVKTEEQVND